MLEVGGGRLGRRGYFQPPEAGITRWTYLDREATRRPDVRADACRLPFPAGAFDAIVSIEVLEYIWEPAAALAECARVTRPGGSLLLSTPYAHRADAADDYWRFTEPALRRLLADADFDVAEWYAQGGTLAGCVNMLRYTVSVQRPLVRRLLSTALSPVFGLLLSLDARLTARHPELSRFTTGYLVRATRRQAHA